MDDKVLKVANQKFEKTTRVKEGKNTLLSLKR